MSSLAAATLLATGLRLVASHGYPDGAPPGFSGGFKEDSCQACHFHQELNAPPGRVAIDGVPATYEPGKVYALTITLTRTGMQLAGFQLTARFKDDGAQAGTLAVGAADGDRVGISRDGVVQYANQKKGGSTIAEAGVARWSINWTAPPTGGPIVFNVAANAADGNGATDGDFVYTVTAETSSSAIAAARHVRLPRSTRRQFLVTVKQPTFGPRRANRAELLGSMWCKKGSSLLLTGTVSSKSNIFTVRAGLYRGTLIQRQQTLPPCSPCPLWPTSVTATSVRLDVST